MMYRNNEVKKTRNKEAFFNFLEINIPLVEDEFQEEYSFLVSTIKDTDSITELNKAFNDVKRHIKFRFETVKNFSQSTAAVYIKRYRTMFIDLKAVFEAKKENIRISDKLFYREGIVNDSIAEATEEKVFVNKYKAHQKIRAVKIGVILFVVYLLGTTIAFAINKTLFILFIYSLIVTGVILGVFVWLKKDYKRYKEESKIWIFILEVFFAIIFVPAFLGPYFEGLLSSVLVLLK